MVKVTGRDWAIIAGLAGVGDILTEHRFSIPVERAVKRALGRAAPVAARGAAAFVPRALGTARFIAMRHPYVTAAVVTYEVVKNREQIRQLIGEGWEVVEPQVEAFRARADPVLTQAAEIAAPIGPGISARTFIGEKLFPSAVKRKKSKFNIAVAAGMRAVKGSTSYGGKGKISPAKKAFSVVVKLAAAKKKKKKAPKSGIRRKIWNAMKGLR